MLGGVALLIICDSVVSASFSLATGFLVVIDTESLGFSAAADMTKSALVGVEAGFGELSDLVSAFVRAPLVECFAVLRPLDLLRGESGMVLVASDFFSLTLLGPTIGPPLLELLPVLD